MKIDGRRAKPVAETQMVSLADIAFLIIFFFLLTSSFMTDRSVVAVPQVPKTKQSESPITVTMDADKKVYLNGHEVDSPDVIENQLKDEFKDTTDAKKLEVRLKIDKYLTFKDYRKLYEAIGNAGGIIAIVHDLPPGPAPLPK